MKTVAILVDVQNIYYTTRDVYQRHFDYNTLWAKVTEGRTVVGANAYAIARSDDKQKQFHNILRGIGFDVKLKPFIQRRDGSAKGDWDVGITLDAIELAEQADIVVLLSGDGDFDLLIKRIQSRFNKEVEVYGVADLTANSLIDAADRFIPIEDNLLL
ncbi:MULTISPECIES: LabA-like NYN domain-containing protein [Aliivibrio]|uniref:LabA-like NYN domain-containing protein n=1 Tax=Aliivibrio TaxID=511678 RepID=UPI0006D0D9FB|nr:MULTISPECIES: NYN domain-containing protein [Aliivibrio]MBD1567846.1 NYN domain-containing protein [Aliivibrio sp. S10_S31]USR96569.1 NYN domain-containing protein [Aliivibrio fischeri ATCC 7744 = JCM 18803 = DSM 507]GGK22286.1 nuclease [Aliivibrio fischeri]